MTLIRTRRLTASFLYHVALACFGLLLLYPFIWLVLSSLKSDPEIFGEGLRFFPKEAQWHNYRDGWHLVPPYTYGRFYLNTFIIVFTGMIGSIASSVFIAFGFARVRFRGRNIWFIILLATMMLPEQVTIIPRYIVWKKLGLLGTYAPLIVPWFFGVPFYVFLIRQFMTGIPLAVDESAYIDGASRFQIFSRIILPLCRPVLFVVAMFSFGNIYRTFLDHLIYINKTSQFTIALALRANVDAESVVAWGPLLAMVSLSLIPPLIIFVIAQKNLTQGIATTGLKG